MYPRLRGVEDARFPRAGHTGWVAGRIGWLVAFFRRAVPREPAPSGWALAFDAAVAVGAAAGAVYEMAERSITQTVVFPGAPGGPAAVGGLLRTARELGGAIILSPRPPHASVAVLFAAALTALPLAARRVYPITVWLTIAAAIVAVHPSYVPPVALGTAVYAAYSAITHSKYRNLAIAMVAVVTVAVAATLGQELPRFPGRLTAIFAIAAAAAAGLGIRELRRRLADSTARLRRAAADAEAATRRALAAERARIASELHDVVTHNVSVMIVQAGAARKIMASSPADSEDALLAVEATGREAMTELRNLLGLLSPAADGREGGSGTCSPGAAAAGAGSDGGFPAAAGTAAGAAAGPRPGGGPAALRPQPGLSELDALIGRVSAAGLPVELQVSGEPRPLSPGADLAAYRVVQEGLTNVLRHTGQAAATVDVEWGEELVIRVSDDGGGSGPGDWNGAADGDGSGLRDGDGGGNGPPGRGLLGLRERLALYGGELAAGPRPGGGWQVRAVMPTGTAS
jgi:signal transduction histidine kinase